MKVLIVKDLLTARSGTTKLTVNLARGFRACGAGTEIRFLGKSDDASLIESTIEDLSYSVGQTRFSRIASRALAGPLLETVLKDAFVSDDIPDFIGGLIDSQTRSRISVADVVVYMNIWSATPGLLSGKRQGAKWILLHHEPPTFQEEPFPVRVALRRYVQRVARSCDCNIAMSEGMARAITVSLGIPVQYYSLGVGEGCSIQEKEPYVLVDTRWTNEREPDFLLEVMAMVPGMDFVMTGQFGSKELLHRFNRGLANRGLMGRLRYEARVDELGLNRLYAHALCYLRWSATHGELGPSVGTLQALSNLCVPIVDTKLGIASTLSANVSPELVVARRPECFAEVVQRLRSDPNYLSSMLRSVDRYRRERTWKDFGMDVLTGLDH